MLQQIQKIISNKLITTVFQPIYNVEEKTVIGYEALSRGPKGSDLYSPEVLFNLATMYDLLPDLELLCREKSITQFAKLGLSGKLFLNISPATLMDKNYPKGETIKLLENSGLSCDQVVIELSEKYPFPNNNILRDAIDKYRQFGFDVAIDDLGAGYSGLKQWSHLSPDIVKIDRYFIDQCDKDSVKCSFLKALFELGKASNAHIIAEGIETREEFELLRDLGMVYAQGFFLAKPTENPPTAYPALDVRTPSNYDTRMGKVAQLAKTAITINYDHSASQIYQLFIDYPCIHSIPVLKDNKPIGMIFRNELMESFSDIYGRSLFSKKCAVEIINAKPVLLEHTMTLEQMSSLLTARDQLELTHAFIVVKNQEYLGVVSVRGLLKAITETKIEQARYANPLTGLPGNVPIEQEIDFMLREKRGFQLAYVDINHFKPFNDIYGYAKGDLLLKELAKSIETCLENKDCFIGHIGGDDFIIMFKQGDYANLCEQVIEDFKKRSYELLSDEHIKQQGYYALNRVGERVFHPLVSLAIGVIQPNLDECNSYHQIADLASNAKSQAKKIEGNGVFICRRQHISRPVAKQLIA